MCIYIYTQCNMSSPSWRRRAPTESKCPEADQSLQQDEKRRGRRFSCLRSTTVLPDTGCGNRHMGRKPQQPWGYGKEGMAPLTMGDGESRTRATATDGQSPTFYPTQGSQRAAAKWREQWRSQQGNLLRQTWSDRSGGQESGGTNPQTWRRVSSSGPAMEYRAKFLKESGQYPQVRLDQDLARFQT